MRNFLTSYLVNYEERLVSLPSNRCGGSRVVPLLVDWRKFGIDLGTTRRALVNTGVKINLANPPQKTLDKVQSVFIDNAGVSSPVSLQCEDTGYTVACADNSQGWFNLETGGARFILYVQDALTPFEQSEKTQLHFSDAPAPAYTTEEKTDEFLTKTQISGKNAFATDVYGDQFWYDILSSETNNSGAHTIPMKTLLAGTPNTTLVLTQLRVMPSSIRVANERLITVRYYHGGRFLMAGIYLTRPYNQPTYDRNPIIDMQGNIAVRLDGALDLTYDVSIQPLVTSNIMTGAGIVSIRLESYIAFARIINPTE